jgi:TusA-related sulfurtransferase
MAIKKIQVGQVLEVLATDPGSKPDIEAWAKLTGHELVSYREADGVHIFRVRRTK